MLGLIVGANLVFSLATEYYGVFAGAVYAEGVALSGISHFGRATYDAVSWSPNFEKPEPCPLVIHLPDGDLNGADLANLDVLRARGWRQLVRDEAMTPELEKALQALPKVADDNPPIIYQRYYGSLLLSVTFWAGMLRSVWVGRGPRGPLERQEGALSLAGKRLSLPLADVDADRILGRPLDRRQSWAYWWW